MAHFAKVVDGIVEQVIVISNEHEKNGQAFINEKLKLEGTWIQTSYNTEKNVHKLGGTPLRKNFAGIGYTYDEALDAFVPPKPYDSWILNEDTCLWESPTPYPDDGDIYRWNEETTSWISAE